MAEYHGDQGSGFLIRCGNEVLLLKRSADVTESGTWGTPGGAIKGTKFNLNVALNSAIRECFEELGWLPEYAIKGHAIYQDGDFRFTTFLVEITKAAKKSWEIELNWENDAAEWYPVDRLPRKLHFGIRYLLKAKPEFFQKI